MKGKVTKNNIYIFSFLVIIFIIVIIFIFLGKDMVESDIMDMDKDMDKDIESFGGRGRRGRRRGGRVWTGPNRGYSYLHNFRRGYRRPSGRRWWNWGWNPNTTYMYDRYPYSGGYCKKGCVYTGDGTWGCQNPGYGANDCMFADDCNWC